MPRLARKKSESGFYHVVLRGIGKQNIFEDDEDKRRFLETLIRFKEELKFEIHAYCLMNNHIHLLIRDTKQEIDRIFKKIAGSYAYYFNWKYDRVGHLFQDRYKSEPIEDDRYYLAVLRYIHQNPQKAGIERATKYSWSSYNEYIGLPKIVDSKFALEIIGGTEEYMIFMSEDGKEVCLDAEDKIRLTDERARDIIKKIARIKNLQEIQQFEVLKRDNILKKLKDEGISIRQISRLTGINRGVVLKA